MFKDYDTALKWAAQEMYSVAYDAPSIYRMRDKPPPGLPNEIVTGLSSIERHNQAANIYSKVLEIEESSADYLLVKYFNKDRCDDALMRYILSGFSGAINRRAMQKIVFEYCGRHKNTQRQLRADLGVGSCRVEGIKSRAFDRLSDIHNRASCLIESILVDAGIVR